jgi:AcrR family transcriptional regulator
MMAEGGQEGQGRPPGAAGAGLSRNQVLDAALQIAETEGIERLTIRGLAGKLGVAPTAIYWHVGGKQALLDGVAGRVIAQLGEVTVRGRGPVARIISIANSLRTTLLERPDLVALVHRQGRTAALFQPARRLLVTEFTVAGVDGAGAALAVQAVLNLVIGSVLLDRQLERQPTQRETLEQLWLLGLPDTPDLPELLKHFSHPVDEKQLFDYTLAVVVGAIVPAS